MNGTFLNLAMLFCNLRHEKYLESIEEFVVKFDHCTSAVAQHTSPPKVHLSTVFQQSKTANECIWARGKGFKKSGGDCHKYSKINPIMMLKFKGQFILILNYLLR